ncbi:MAG: hypothetical protein ACLFPF_10660 [Halanaerobiales bacterium]
MLAGKEEMRMKEEKKLGLPSALAAGIGLIVATSCLVSLSQGL